MVTIKLSKKQINKPIIFSNLKIGDFFTMVGSKEHLYIKHHSSRVMYVQTGEQVQFSQSCQVNPVDVDIIIKHK